MFTREKMPLYLFLLFSSIMIIESGLLEKRNYGPYQVVWSKYETCKGPKPSNCGKFEIKDAQNMSDVVFHLNFPRDCPVTAAKIIVSNHNNNATNKLWTYVLNKPCEHFVLGPILVETFNLTKICKINKGQYDVHLDYQSKALTFLGKNFFYGTYDFKVMSYNKGKNFFCVYTSVEFKLNGT